MLNVDVAMNPGSERRSAGAVLPDGLLDAAPSLTPAKRLMLAVLEGAVSDYQKYATASSGRGRRIFAEAAWWIMSTATDQPLDFENVCAALELDPSFVRGGLQRWCIARRSEPGPSRTMLRFPFRRVSGSRHTIVALS